MAVARADLVGSTSTFALAIYEVIVQVNLTRLHVDYNPNSTAMLVRFTWTITSWIERAKVEVEPTRSARATAMLNSKTTLQAARGCGIRQKHFLCPGLFITSPDHLEGFGWAIANVTLMSLTWHWFQSRKRSKRTLTKECKCKLEVAYKHSYQGLINFQRFQVAVIERFYIRMLFFPVGGEILISFRF